MDKLNINQVKEMILYIAQEIIDNKAYLTEVDQKIGDGDHGIGMETGFTNVKNTIEQKQYASINDLFRDVGMAMLNSMGGASGVIFSAIFLGGQKDSGKEDELTADEFAKMMEKSLNMIKRRGKAELGDKTMVDAFEPAVRAMADYSAGNKDFGGMLSAGELAAEQGMLATKNYVARFGRAKSLMERSIGCQDAGATSVYLMFRAMRKWAEKQKEA
ncbi:MAG: dihydroxyacetone kinase subunit L [Clostridiaceae bacterium]|jgi:dihydroxyacetone kinase phosphoprotein-dependent L subunit|nr:dihydroxyacetone kinase subunit L [Clostridiaceae bacterium]